MSAKQPTSPKEELYVVDTNIGLIAFSIGIVILGALFLFYLTRRTRVLEVDQRPVPNQPAVNRQPRILNRPGAARAAPQFVPGEEGAELLMDDYSDAESLDDVAEGLRARSGKIGVKKMRKLEMKEEKRRMREAEAEARAEQSRRNAELEKKRELEAEKEQAEEERREAEVKAAEEERKRKEHEEYLQLKQQFGVEEEGYDADQSEAEVQNQLNMFIDHIKNNKVVNIEELASHFNLRSADCVSRIKSLQESQVLTGVLDDRGKFIYVSEEEMLELAKFIKQRGRISISELASSCTSRNIISLQPKVDNQALVSNDSLSNLNVVQQEVKS